jgi:hypothetical protein
LSAPARQRPLEPTLQQAGSSTRKTNEWLSSSGARRRARRARAVPGLSGVLSAPRGCQWRGGDGSGSREEKAGQAFIGECALAKGSRGSSHMGRGMEQRWCEQQQPMAASGWRGGPMAEGGAGRPAHEGAARGAGQGAQVPRTGARGTVHRPVVTGPSRRACTATYGGGADVAGRDVVRAAFWL